MIDANRVDIENCGNQRGGKIEGGLGSTSSTSIPLASLILLKTLI
jgi:hypothetical protein